MLTPKHGEEAGACESLPIQKRRTTILWPKRQNSVEQAISRRRGAAHRSPDFLRRPLHVAHEVANWRHRRSSSWKVSFEGCHDAQDGLVESKCCVY